MPLHPCRCPACANPRLMGGICPECRRRPPAFRSVLALGAYRKGLRAAIHHWKFGGGWDLAFALGDRLVEAPAPPVDVLVPLPLHPDRERARGYNQALLLTQVLSGGWHLPWRHGLRRLRATEPQAMLRRASRQVNVAGAFAAVAEQVRGRRIGLVDDVFTSGATAQAAAVALLAGGAVSVDVIVVARAIPLPWEQG